MEINFSGRILPGLIILLSLTTLVSFYIPLILIFALLFFWALSLFKEKFVIVYTIVAFLTVTGESADVYRNYLNIFLIFSLASIFIYRFGFEWKSYKRVPKEVFYFLVLYFLTLIFSVLFSSYPMLGIAAMFRSILFFIICYIYYSFIDKKQYYTFFVALFIVVSIIGVTLLKDVTVSGLSSFLLGGIVTRYAGIYENPNYVGLLVLIALPLSLIIIKLHKGRLLRVWMILFSIFQIFVLFLSNSRAAILGTFITILIVLFKFYKKVLIRYLLPGALLLIIYMLSTLDVANLMDTYFRVERMNSREAFWQSGIDAVTAHPYFGLGTDTFDKYFFTYAPWYVVDIFNSGAWAAGRPHPHNFFLYFTAENGILGFITSVSLFILFFYFVIKTLKTKTGIEIHSFSVAILGIGIAVLFRAFYEVTGILTYGFIIRDLPFWIIFITAVHFYQESGAGKKEIISSE